MPGDTDSIDNEAQVIEEAAPTGEAPVEPQAPVPAATIIEALQTCTQDPRKALLSALTEGSENAPQIEMLMKLLGGGETDEAARREEIREEVRAEQEAAIADLSETAQKLFDEREQARARLETLAAALGACPVCFGENLLCETCHGAGRPGARAPASQEFRTYILPAVERVRAAIRRDPYRRPWPRPAPGVTAGNQPQPLTRNGGLM
jgi:uncharacterized membrane protein YccC